MAMKVRPDTLVKNGSKSSPSAPQLPKNVTSLADFRFQARHPYDVQGKETRDQTLCAGVIINHSLIHINETNKFFKQEVLARKGYYQPFTVNGYTPKELITLESVASNDEVIPTSRLKTITKSKQSNASQFYGDEYVLSQDLNLGLASWLKAYCPIPENSSVCWLDKGKDYYLARQMARERVRSIKRFVPRPEPPEWRKKRNGRYSHPVLGWRGLRPPTVPQLLSESYSKGFKLVRLNCPRTVATVRRKALETNTFVNKVMSGVETRELCQQLTVHHHTDMDRLWRWFENAELSDSCYSQKDHICYSHGKAHFYKFFGNVTTPNKILPPLSSDLYDGKLKLNAWGLRWFKTRILRTNPRRKLIRAQHKAWMQKYGPARALADRKRYFSWLYKHEYLNPVTPYYIGERSCVVRGTPIYRRELGDKVLKGVPLPESFIRNTPTFNFLWERFLVEVYRFKQDYISLHDLKEYSKRIFIDNILLNPDQNSRIVLNTIKDVTAEVIHTEEEPVKKLTLQAAVERGYGSAAAPLITPPNHESIIFREVVRSKVTPDRGYSRDEVANLVLARGFKRLGMLFVPEGIDLNTGLVTSIPSKEEEEKRLCL